MNRRVLWLIVLFFAAGAAGPACAEIPYLPCEPFDAGPIYTREDLAAMGRGHVPRAGLPNDPFLAKGWHLLNEGQPDDKDQIGTAGCDIRCLDAWKIYAPKRAIVLAILDSGLDLTHEDIDPAVLWTNPGESGLDAAGRDKAGNGVDDDENGFIDDVHGWNFCRNSPAIQEDQYHGTHVGSLLCAVTNNGRGIAGTCPNIKIMLVKIFGLGSTLYSDEIAKAIRYAVDNGAQVLSNSYGSPSYSKVMEDAIAYTRDKGALFVCAAGNSRKPMDLEEEKDYPSCYGVANQLVVGATDNRDLSTFANFGTMVEISAPGQNMFSLFPGSTYRSFSGTSQACPLAAGAAVMVWSQHPEWTWSQVKQALLDGADQIRGLGRYSRGGLRLNLLNALAGKTGRRLPVEDFSRWQEEPRVVESSHPYWNGKIATFTVSVPGAAKVRLHFSRIGIDHFGDELCIRDAQGGLVECINGVFEAGWSEVIDGDHALLTLTTGEYVNDFGFRIDRVGWLPSSVAPTGEEPRR